MSKGKTKKRKSPKTITKSKTSTRQRAAPVLITAPIWLNATIITLTALALLLCSFWIYISWLRPEIKPTTLDDLNITTVTDPNAPEANQSVYVFEANIYENADNSGLRVQELKLNYFTNQNTKTLKSIGMQRVGEDDPSAPYLGDNLDVYVDDRFSYFERFGDTFYTAGTQMNRDFPFITTIDNEPFLLKLNGKQPTSPEWWNLWGLGGLIVDSLKWDYYSWTLFFYTVMDMVQNNSIGYGSNVIIFNAAPFFEARKYNPQSTQFDDTNFAGEVLTHVAIKYNYHAQGLTYSKQSIFKLVGDDGNDFNIGLNPSDYWQGVPVFRINEIMFNNFYYASDDTYRDTSERRLVLKDEIVAQLLAYKKLEKEVLIYITLNLEAISLPGDCIILDNYGLDQMGEIANLSIVEFNGFGKVSLTILLGIDIKTVTNEFPFSVEIFREVKE